VGTRQQRKPQPHLKKPSELFAELVESHASTG
jgi:hypothetical protein